MYGGTRDIKYYSSSTCPHLRPIELHGRQGWEDRANRNLFFASTRVDPVDNKLMRFVKEGASAFYVKDEADLTFLAAIDFLRGADALQHVPVAVGDDLVLRAACIEFTQVAFWRQEAAWCVVVRDGE